MMEYLTGILPKLGIYDGMNFNEPRLHDVRHSNVEYAAEWFSNNARPWS